ncbi:MAG: hypothetical protein RR052_06200, partial [Oscillospiraceae bacterium]
MSKSIKNKTSPSFAEKHPIINLILGLLMLIAMLTLGFVAIYFVMKYIATGISLVADWLSLMASKLDAVIIVAMITGAISIISVIFTSVVGKRIDYKKSRQSYLAQKREKPYGEFVDMVYKIQQNSKNNVSYTEKEMIADLSHFSRGITLWGSANVVKKWVAFRENGVNPDAGTK